MPTFLLKSGTDKEVLGLHTGLGNSGLNYTNNKISYFYVPPLNTRESTGYVDHTYEAGLYIWTTGLNIL